MSSYFLNWGLLILVSFAASAVPGISFALVLKNTLTTAKYQTGLFTAAGLSIGMLIYSLLVCLGLDTLFFYTGLDKILKFCSGIYLGYLGLKSILQEKKAPFKKDILEKTQNHIIPNHSAFLMGFMTNVLNPKVMIFFIALFSQFIQKDTSLFFSVSYALTPVLIEFLWFSVLSILITKPFFLKSLKKHSYYTQIILGLVFIFLSISILVSL